jgi:hypothetical protein
MDFHVP